MRILLIFCIALMLVGATRSEATDSQGGSPAACSNVAYGGTNLGAGADPTSPPNPNGPTLVGIGIFANQLRSLDAVRDQYTFRGHLKATWCDPRLAFDPNEAGSDERVFFDADAKRQRDVIWLPGGFPANRSGSFETTERVVRIFPDGTVYNDLNLSIQLHAAFDLRRFPFDSQQLELIIDSFRWSADEMVFVPDPTTAGFAPDFSIQEWEIEGVNGHAEEFVPLRSAVPNSRFIYEIRVSRRAGFYLWKVMLPILIIVALSWSVFWISHCPRQDDAGIVQYTFRNRASEHVGRSLLRHPARCGPSNRRDFAMAIPLHLHPAPRRMCHHWRIDQTAAVRDASGSPSGP